MIVPLLPPHTTYIEPFVGTGAIFFNKPKAQKNVLNDLDKDTYRFLKLLQKAPVDISKYPESKTVEGHKALWNKKPTSVADKIVHELIRTCSGFTGNMVKEVKHIYRGPSIHNKVKRIGELKEKLKGVKITSEDYAKVIQKNDNKDALIFLDPPYENTDKRFGYAEDKGFDFNRLRDVLAKVKGKFLMTINDSPNIRKIFAGFHQRPFKPKTRMAVTTTHGETKKYERKELFVSNYELPKRGGGWTDVFNPAKVYNEVANPDSILRRRISDVSKGVRTNFPPSSRKTIEQYGDWTIRDLQLRRIPFPPALNTAMQLITLGQWNKAMAESNKEQLFHLGIILNLEKNGQSVNVIVEKNAVINVGVEPPRVEGEETSDGATPQNTTLSMFLERGIQAMGESRFFSYDPYSNNCQDFVAFLLRANGVYSQQEERFVKQNVDDLLTRLPWWTRAVAKGVAQIGNIANVVHEGGRGVGHPYDMDEDEEEDGEEIIHEDEVGEPPDPAEQELNLLHDIANEGDVGLSDEATEAIVNYLIDRNEEGIRDSILNYAEPDSVDEIFNDLRNNMSTDGKAQSLLDYFVNYGGYGQYAHLFNM